ncbi:MAG: MFS transporter [Candidatus Acidiferrales bacterium]
MSEPAIAPAPSSRWLSRGVLGIGLASLFSDWGHEAATAVLPAFLASLGAPAIALGIIEGVSDGLSSFAKLAGGWIADRPTRRKPTGVVGYFATALSTFGYSFAQTWPAILVLRALGWVGRGGRGPSRDTLLADCVTPGQAGRAFGFERAMDTLGAVLGPLSATALIGVLGLRGLMRWTLVPGIAAALAFAFLAPAGKEAAVRHTPSFAATIARLPKSYWRFLAGVFAHGVGDFAPTLLILRATQMFTPRYGIGRAAAISVGLYTFYNFVNAAAAYPAGALGDRIGKRGLLASGYLVSCIACVGFVFAPPSIPALAALFALAGIHAGVQQALEKSLAAELLPAEFRGSGFGVLATANGIGDLVSSVVVGALWSAVSPAAGFLYAGIFTLFGAILIYRSR